MLSPVLLFVYNRFEHTKKTIEALQNNKLAEKTELFIFSDGPKNKNNGDDVQEIRNYLKNINGFKKVKIIESEKNKGLANSIISGVTEVIELYEKVIVIEDDLITSENFLEYMNEALNFYEKEKKIWSISGYNLPIKIPTGYNKDVYISPRGCSWGWATWRDRWNTNNWILSKKDVMEIFEDKNNLKRFNLPGHDMAEMLKLQFEGKIDSWAIRWCYNQYKQNKYTIYPIVSKIYNIGLDGSGTHCENDKTFNVFIDKKSDKTVFLNSLDLNVDIMKEYRKIFEGNKLRGKILFSLKELGLYYPLKKIIRGNK